ncbi:MAG: VanZ family protein [Coprobacter sp.]|nr:VanZ family protein [Coprobacter sp.]
MTDHLFTVLQRRIPPYLPTAVVVAGILYLSLHSFSDIPDNNLFRLPHLDKAVHFGMYFGLTATFWFDDARHAAAKRKFPLRHLYRLWLFPVLLGGALEIAQALLTADRSGDIFDFLANTAGAAAGYLTGARFIGPPIQTLTEKIKDKTEKNR